MNRDVQYKIEPNLHRETVALIRSAHMDKKPVTDRTNPSVEPFLRSESPPISIFETADVPIFPRSSQPGFKGDSSTSSTKVPRSMDDMQCIAPVVEVEEEDLSLEHMRVVDGWSMYRFYRLLNSTTERTDLPAI